jgi:hypothetical protein
MMPDLSPVDTFLTNRTSKVGTQFIASVNSLRGILAKIRGKSLVFLQNGRMRMGLTAYNTPQ